MTELSWAEKEKLQSEWLQQLKAGDEVAIAFRGGFRGNNYTFAIVTKITATQIVVGSQRYKISSGRKIGEGYSSYWLQRPTDELKAEIALSKETSQLRYQIESINWRDQPIEILRAVNEVLK